MRPVPGFVPLAISTVNVPARRAPTPTRTSARPAAAISLFSSPSSNQVSVAELVAHPFFLVPPKIEQQHPSAGQQQAVRFPERARGSSA